MKIRSLFAGGTVLLASVLIYFRTGGVRKADPLTPAVRTSRQFGLANRPPAEAVSRPNAIADMNPRGKELFVMADREPYRPSAISSSKVQVHPEQERSPGAISRP